MTFYVNPKFIKYEKRLRKEGNMPRLTYQSKSLPLQREFGLVALPSVRSNGPTDPLHISCICSIWKILHFYSPNILSCEKISDVFFRVESRKGKIEMLKAYCLPQS
jgi:hypothetical protein